MMIRPNSVLLAVSLAALAHPVFAAPDEARVLAAVRKAYPGTKVDRAERTPMPGVYEIWMGGNVAFVSIGDPRYMVFGRLVDLKTMRDLTMLPNYETRMGSRGHLRAVLNCQPCTRE